jgi:uncharacterized membrane protein
MFIGLFTNFLYPPFGVSRPLSTVSLVISYSVVILILCFIAYRRNKKEIGFWNGFNFRLDIKKDQMTSPLIFSIMFPFLTIFGVYLMNTTENNIVLLILPFLIVFYAAFIVYFNKRIPKITYPIAMLMIGLALALIVPLRGEYMFMGGDGGIEYYFFWLTATNAYWNVGLSRGGVGCVNACLSVALLHAIFQSLLGLTPEFTYKLVTPLLLSVTPLALFILFTNYMKESYAFLAALFFASQFNFIYCINSARILIAIFFFTLSIMFLFDKKTDRLNKKILFLIFMFSLILSYYSYCYIFAILMLLSWVIVSLTTIKFVNLKKNVTVIVVILCFTVTFFWWSQITESHFTTATSFVESTFRSLTQAFLTESSDIMAQKAIGRGLQGAPEISNLVIYYITLGLIAIGSVDLIRRWKRSKFGVEYTSMVLSCLILWALMLTAPRISESVGLERAYFPTLIILAPCLLIGVHVICRLLSFETWDYIKQKLGELINLKSKQTKSNNSNKSYHKFVVLITSIVIILNLFVATGITYQMFGDPHSVILNSKGLQYDIWYVHTQEVISVGWLFNHNKQSVRVHALGRYANRVFTFFPEDTRKLKNGESKSKKYIYLGYLNVVERMMISGSIRKGGYYEPMENYSHLFVGKSRIYDNGGSEIWN